MLEVLASEIKEEKGYIHRNKTSIFANDVFTQENPIESARGKKKARVSEFSKVAGFKVYKNQLYFYILSMNGILNFKKITIYNGIRSNNILIYKSNKI